MPKLSVAMTTCNGERFIRQQLASLLAQTRQPDEVVITDDCSADRTVEIVREFIDRNALPWRLEINAENLGFVRNFQKALSLTSGEIVFLCDQDDVWHKEKLERMAKRFAANEAMLAVSSSFTVIDADGRESDAAGPRGSNNYGLLVRPVKAKLTKMGLEQIVRGNISPGCTAAYRRSVVDAYLAHSAGELAHDYELNLIAAASDGLYFYNLPLIGYRLHGGNTIGFSGRTQSRTEIAAEKLAAAQVLRTFPDGERLYRFSAERLRALTSGRTLPVLRLWRYAEYRRFYTLRERLGDIAFSVGKGRNT